VSRCFLLGIALFDILFDPEGGRITALRKVKLVPVIVASRLTRQHLLYLIIIYIYHISNVFQYGYYLAEIAEISFEKGWRMCVRIIVTLEWR
jgi:hypothetical protein